MRIHFSDVDLGRTRLALQIHHLWEVVGSVQVLRHREGGLFFDRWRGWVRECVRTDNRLRGVLEIVVDLAPHAARFPDLLTPVDELDDVEAAFEAVASTSRARLRAAITRLRAPTSRLHHLTDGELRALRSMRAALHLYHRIVIHPHLDEIDTGLRVDSAGRMYTFLRDGVEGVLAGLEPFADWDYPVLSLDHSVDRDLHLGGQGLRLAPSYFCLRRPVALADPVSPPTLVFPIKPTSRLLDTDGTRSDPLNALLGLTRATILRSVLGGSTTTDLARRTQVSAATVSHHTAVLRDAGMIITRRHGTSATHLLTPLGLRMLAGDV
jgi:DNA-binding transcriptional ArsR family regulator